MIFPRKFPSLFDDWGVLPYASIKLFWSVIKCFVYAHMQVVVAFLVVKFYSFLAITRLHELRIGRNIMQIDPTGPPELFQQPRSLDNSREVEKSEISKIQKSSKKVNDYFQLSVIPFNSF